MPLQLEDELLQAVAHQDTAAVSHLLAAGADANAGLLLSTDTALSTAIRNGDEASMRLLLQHGPLACMGEQEARAQLMPPTRASYASALGTRFLGITALTATTWALNTATGRLPVGSLALSVGGFVCRHPWFIRCYYIMGFSSTSSLSTRALNLRVHGETLMGMTFCHVLYRYVVRPLVVAVASLPAPPDAPGLVQDLLFAIPFRLGLDAFAMFCWGIAKRCALIDSNWPRWIGHPPLVNALLDPGKWQSQGERVVLSVFESELVTESMVLDLLRAGALALQPYDRSEVARKLLSLSVDRCWPELTTFLVQGGVPLDKGATKDAESLRWSPVVDLQRYIAPLDSTDHLGDAEFSGRPVLSFMYGCYAMRPVLSTFNDLVRSDRFIELSKRPADDADETEMATSQARITEALRMMDIIRDGGADPLLVDGGGWSAFTYLVGRRSDDPSVVRHMRELWVQASRQRSPDDQPGSLRARSLLLHAAINTTYPDLDILQFLLNCGIPPESENADGKTPLFTAAYMNNHTAAMGLLLDYGADPNNGGSRGYPPTFRTLHDASLDKFVFLLDHGADPNGTKGTQSILEAVLELSLQLSVPKAQLARILVERGAIVFDERRIPPCQPLLTAARQNNFAGWDGTTLDLLIENIPRSQRQKQLDAALHAACLESEDRTTLPVASTFTIFHLLQRGANPSAGQLQSGTLLHLICRTKQVSHHYYRRDFEALLRRGVLDVNARDSDGMTALHLAVLHKSRDFALLLLKHGADPNLPDSRGSTPLQLLCSAAPPEYTIAHSADDMNAGADEERYRGVRGQAAWGFVSRKRMMDIQRSLVSEEIFQALADYGADVVGVVGGGEGMTLLMRACAQGNSVLVGNILFRLGEQPSCWARAIRETGPAGKTALHMAAEGGHVDTLKVLIDPRQILRSQRNLWRMLAIEEDRAVAGGSRWGENGDGDDDDEDGEQPGRAHKAMLRGLREYQSMASIPAFLRHGGIHLSGPDKVKLTIRDARRREEERICFPNISVSTWSMTTRTDGSRRPLETPRDSQGRTSLHLAAMGGHRDAVHLLLEHADIPIDAADNVGSTAAGLALENNFYGVHSMLEQARCESSVHRHC